MTEPVRTVEELKRGLQHIFYELEMLMISCRRLKAGTPSDSWESNAYLESALVHARCLINFFKGAGYHKTDLRPTDFSDDDLRLSAAVKPLLDDVVVINKHLGHLTWERVTDPHPVWEPGDIHDKIYATCVDWFREIQEGNPELEGSVAMQLEHLLLVLNRDQRRSDGQLQDSSSS